MFKKCTEQGNRKWFHLLPNLINFYNEKIHSSIGISPNEASKNPEKLQTQINNENNINENNRFSVKSKFNIGDRVRIFKYKNKFEKGYTAKWTNEIFVINEIYFSDPVVYGIIDLKGEEIVGRFYENELQKTQT